MSSVLLEKSRKSVFDPVKRIGEAYTSSKV